MDIFNAIRSFIFFIAGLVLILFPKQILKMQYKAENYLVQRFHINFIRFYTKFEEKKGIRVNIITSICFFIISITLVIFSIIN